MARADGALRFPLEVHVPSGRVLRLSRGERRAVPDTLLGHVEALSGAVVRVEEIGQGRGPFDLDDLALEDFHVLRTIVAAMGQLPEAEVTRSCRNCGDPCRVALSRAVPLGPFLDGELDDEELDEDFDFDETHELRVDGDKIARVKLSPLTLRRAKLLFHALSAPDKRRASRKLGVVALDGESVPGRVARKIDKLTDDGWAALVDLYESAHYPPRLAARVTCDTCDAENRFLAPRLREFPEHDEAAAPLPEPEDIAQFPSPDAFFAAMNEHGQKLSADLGVSAVPLLLEEGVPHVDDGGQPLLGSYTPPLDGDAPEPPTVRLYYRTFRAMWLDEGPYDVDAEIFETIEHELSHHAAFLRGHDETDDDERALIVEDRRRVLGKRHADPAPRTGVLASFQRTWPLWAILALLVALTYLGVGK